MITGPMPGPDGLLRCPWALSATEYLASHDNEWGPAGHQRARALRADDSRGVPVGAVLDHCPPQAGELSMSAPSPDLIRGGSPPSPRMTSRDCCVIQASSETAPKSRHPSKRSARCRSWSEVFRAGARLSGGRPPAAAPRGVARHFTGVNRHGASPSRPAASASSARPRRTR